MNSIEYYQDITRLQYKNH